MGLFWKRKGKDQFVTLGLNEPSVSQSPQDEPVTLPTGKEPERVIHEESAPVLVEQPVLEPVATGAGTNSNPDSNCD